MNKTVDATKTATAIVGTLLLALLGTTAAHANDMDYLQSIQAPTELGLQSADQLEKSIYYLKTPNYFGSEKVASADARLRPKSEDPSIFVQFKSAVVSATLQEQLKQRGVKIAAAKEGADLILGGEILYQDQYFPNPPRRLTFTEKLDPPAANASGGNKSVPLAALELAPMYMMRNSSPSAFGAALLQNLVEVTGASKLFSSPSEKNAENFLLLDCYDKSTRKSPSCISNDQLLLSYRAKVRVQAIDLKAYLGRPGASSSEFTRARIIARTTEGRAATSSRLIELLADATAELVSGFGKEPSASQPTTPADSENTEPGPK
jgi:hypothetical protein